MKKNLPALFMATPLVLSLMLLLVSFCDTTDPHASKKATVRIKNYFNNPSVTAFQPPWTIMECSYRGVEFGKIGIGDSSDVREVEAGIDYVLMVASWDDPMGADSNCLPIASKVMEEVVEGQTRTIVIGLSNHQGPCPPEGVQPIPEVLYEKIRQLWPQYNFKPYAQRNENPECAD
jgi:hypothetical protein